MNNNRPVNLYILMQRFWRENEYEPFSTAAIALYFFLINRANTRLWQMPFKCPTSVISSAIQVTRQTVVNARESLRVRNLIIYSKGTGKGSHPMYSLVLTDALTECLSDELTEILQDCSTVGLSDSLTPYNIEDRNIKRVVHLYDPLNISRVGTMFSHWTQIPVLFICGKPETHLPVIGINQSGGCPD